MRIVRRRTHSQELACRRLDDAGGGSKMAGLPNDSDVGRSARKRIAWRLLPFLFVSYIIAFLDRANIGAAALQMPNELGFSEKVVGLGAGMFFIGYLVLEIP